MVTAINENNKIQAKYQEYTQKADFVDSVFDSPYEGPHQFKQTDSSC